MQLFFADLHSFVEIRISTWYNFPCLKDFIILFFVVWICCRYMSEKVFVSIDLMWDIFN